MYAILSDGALIALCDKPRYVRLNPDSGSYVESTLEKADGIAVNGELYNLHGGNAIPDAPEAVIRQDGTAEYIFGNRVRIEQNEETHNAMVVGLEDAMCENDTAIDERLSAIENALCELDGGVSDE